ncbi:MAG: hypothetical protein Q9177_001223, partial [Variospora cf. flavescens]
MASLFSSGKYSDLTITCRDRTFHVHRLFLCSASRFFTAACDGLFKVSKEAQNSQIYLSDDDPETLERLLRYLYTTNYDDNDVNVNDAAEETNGKLPVANASSTSSAQRDNPTSLQVMRDAFEPEKEDESAHHQTPAIMNNAAVYALAEKNDIASLKNLAKETFEDRCACFRWGTENLVATLEFVYTSTPATDRGLRDIMARICLQRLDDSCGKTLDTPQLQELMTKEGALGVADGAFQMLIEKLKELGTERDKKASDLMKERLKAANKQNEMAAKVRSLETQLASATD